MMVSAPNKDEERQRLREWIKKRGKKNVKKGQQELKKWMQQNDVFQKYLFNELLAQNINSLDTLKGLTVTKLDVVLRKVRTDKFAETRNQTSRNKVDKALVAFEKKWRRLAKPKVSKKKGKKRKKKGKTVEVTENDDIMD